MNIPDHSSPLAEGKPYAHYQPPNPSDPDGFLPASGSDGPT
ncbi:hypothetical protein ABIE28_003608 [Devosia sp. 2618]